MVTPIIKVFVLPITNNASSGTANGSLTGVLPDLTVTGLIATLLFATLVISWMRKRIANRPA